MKLQFKLNLLKQFIGASLAFALTQPLHANTFKTQQWQTTNGAQVVFLPSQRSPYA